MDTLFFMLLLLCIQWRLTIQAPVVLISNSKDMSKKEFAAQTLQTQLISRRIKPKVPSLKQIEPIHLAQSFSTLTYVYYENLGDEGHSACSYPQTQSSGSNNTTTLSLSNLAIARTGSEYLHRVLSYHHQPTHHDHICTMMDLYQRGARRILMTIRAPTARIISGYQRRLDRSISQNAKVTNVEFHQHFNGSAGLDLFISALRDPAHELHNISLRMTYGAYKQSYMSPMVEYYLQSRVMQGRDLESDSQKTSFQILELRFLCTESLDNDLVLASKYWNTSTLVPISKKGKVHQSRFSSEELLSSSSFSSQRSSSSYSSNMGNQNISSYDITISQSNLDFIYQVYKKDYDLYKKVCIQNQKVMIFECDSDTCQEKEK